MPTRTPEEVLLLLARALTDGGLETAVALYEPGATFVAQPGAVVTGTEAIREVLSGFVALKRMFDLRRCLIRTLRGTNTIPRGTVPASQTT